MQVTVALKNPPPGGNYWQLILFNEVGGDSVRLGMHIPVDQPMTLESLPAGWAFPLYFDIMIYGMTVSPYNIVLRPQSAYGPEWGDYTDATIPGYGSYYYNVATEQFELIEPPEVVPCEISIDAPDSAEEGETVNVAAIIRNVSAYDYSYKTEIYAEATLLLSTDNIITSEASRGYITSFIMPARDITILVWVERWAVDHWIYDNSASRVVSVEAVPPPPRPPVCSISIDAPASAEEGDTVEAIATITNNSEDAQRYKIQMYAGADLIAEWDDTIPGDSANDYAESFTMPASNITILVWVELWWDGKWGYDKAASRVVSVEAVPEYRGTIITKELEYDESRGNIPVY